MKLTGASPIAPLSAARGSMRFGAAAAVIRGGWALLVNAGAGWESALRALGAQLVWSFAASFTLSMLHRTLFRAGGTPNRGFWLSAVGATAIGVGGGTLIHELAGTPNVALTMAPSLALASIAFTAASFRLRAAALRAAAGP